MQFLLGSVQMDCQLGDVTANLEKAQHFLDEAVSKGVKLLLFPELFSTGYDLKEKTADFAETNTDSTVQFLTTQAQKHQLYLCGCYIEKDGDKVYNTAILCGPTGIIGKHRKVNLWSAEQKHFTPGEDFSVFETELGKIGLLVCYDADFPEAARALALQAAEIILCPTAGTPAFEKLYGNFICSRAFENSCFFALANRVGQENELTYVGLSKIVNPKGEIIAAAQTEETLVHAPIDLAAVASQRDKVPYLKEFKGDVYKKYL